MFLRSVYLRKGNVVCLNDASTTHYPPKRPPPHIYFDFLKRATWYAKPRGCLIVSEFRRCSNILIISLAIWPLRPWPAAGASPPQPVGS